MTATEFSNPMAREPSTVFEPTFVELHPTLGPRIVSVSRSLIAKVKFTEIFYSKGILSDGLLSFKYYLQGGLEKQKPDHF